MVKVISQETFDSVVKENVEEFDMTLEDAVEESCKEFESQGILLSNIVKNMRISEEGSMVHDILEALKSIKEFKNSDATVEIPTESFSTFTAQCKLSIAHRMLATKEGAYPVLTEVLEKHDNQDEVVLLSLKALTALTECNPDILEQQGCGLMLSLMDKWSVQAQEIEIPEYLCRWCTESCLRHENNRQNLVKAGAHGKVVALLQGHRSSAKIVRFACKCLRSFILDDDVRCAFGKAHDHARTLVEELSVIKVSLELLKDWMTESEPASELLLTVSKLCVRAEYCQEAVDNNALTIINDVLVSFPDHQGLTRQAALLLKSICGNDKVKREAMKSGSPELIIRALTKHEASAPVCEACVAALSVLALREVNHSKELVKMGAAQAIVQAMKIHPKHKQLQKMGCMAIRNSAVRIPEHCAVYAECGVEDVIRNALIDHEEEIKDLAKAALRDLNLKVQLDEQWRGTGHEISR
ncbi:armadillo repeat-containing protein 6 isoform X2 [Oratosquilla oratoria]